MKKAFKKTLLLVAFTLLSVVALTACGKKESSGKTTIKVGTNGKPAPFIYTVDSQADALYITKDGVYLAGYDIGYLQSYSNYRHLPTMSLTDQLKFTCRCTARRY